MGRAKVSVSTFLLLYLAANQGTGATAYASGRSRMRPGVCAAWICMAASRMRITRQMPLFVFRRCTRLRGSGEFTRVGYSTESAGFRVGRVVVRTLPSCLGKIRIAGDWLRMHEDDARCIILWDGVVILPVSGLSVATGDCGNSACAGLGAASAASLPSPRRTVAHANLCGAFRKKLLATQCCGHPRSRAGRHSGKWAGGAGKRLTREQSFSVADIRGRLALVP